MATVKGANRTNIDAEPSVKVPPGERAGRLRLLYDSYTAPGALALNDVIQMGDLLPAGARVVNVVLKHDDLGTTGVADVGWAASAEGGEVADPNGFLAAVDLNAAANTVEMIDEAASAGMRKSFSESVQPEVLITTATDAGGDLQLFIWYVTD